MDTKRKRGKRKKAKYIEYDYEQQIDQSIDDWDEWMVEHGSQKKDSMRETGDVITSRELEEGMTPGEYMYLRRMALESIITGMSRELVEEDEEIDEGLAELEKK